MPFEFEKQKIEDVILVKPKVFFFFFGFFMESYKKSGIWQWGVYLLYFWQSRNLVSSGRRKISGRSERSGHCTGNGQNHSQWQWKHSVRKEAETDNRGKQKPDLSWRKTSVECGNPAFYSIVSICKMAGKRNSRICRLSWGFSWESIHRQRSECYSNRCFKSRQLHTGFCIDLGKSRQGNSGKS